MCKYSVQIQCTNTVCKYSVQIQCTNTLGLRSFVSTVITQDKNSMVTAASKKVDIQRFKAVVPDSRQVSHISVNDATH